MKVFLSYAAEDRGRVEPYFDRLAAADFDPWMDCRKLLPGQNWEAEIDFALRAANVVIAFLSPRSVTKRGFVQREVNFAVDRMNYKLPTDVYLIPALLEPVEVPPHLANRFQYVDLSVDTAWDQIIASLHLAASQQQIAVERGVAFGPFRVLERIEHIEEEGRDDVVSITSFQSESMPAVAAELTRTIERELVRPLEIAEGEEAAPHEGWRNCELVYASRRIVSISIYSSVQFERAAHPMHMVECFVFEIGEGLRRIELIDLFVDAGAAILLLSELCKRELYKRRWEESEGADPDEFERDWIEGGCAPEAANFSQFLLLRGHVSIQFAPYHVGPYAQGFQVVDVPYFELRRLLRADGPHRLAMIA